MRRLSVIVLCGLLLFVVGCRESAQPAPTPNPDIVISLETPASPFAIGESAITFQVTDAQGVPINNATVFATGDMAHAGMAPVTGTVQGGVDGRYVVPFEWSMGGDWFLTVVVTLPDGRTTTGRFDVSVNAS